MQKETLSDNTHLLYEENFKRSDMLLTQIEGSLRKFIAQHKLGNQLIDEWNCWDESGRKPRLHRGRLGSYDFERNQREWPSRSIRWEGKDKLCYLIQIYPDNDMARFLVWNLVSLAPFGFPEPGTFQRSVVINLPMAKKDFGQLLEESYQLLDQEGKKIAATVLK